MGALYAGRRDRSGNRRQKLLYVSPFIKMAMRYHFRVLPPGERVKLRIPKTDREGPLLAATFSGRRLTTAALLRSFFALPLVTLKIVAAIHWGALRLWLKDARLAPRPNAAAAKPAVIPAWRPANAMLILARHCPRAVEIEDGSIVCAEPWRHII
jgi:uncharacterized protein